MDSFEKNAYGMDCNSRNVIVGKWTHISIAAPVLHHFFLDKLLNVVPCTVTQLNGTLFFKI